MYQFFKMRDTKYSTHAPTRSRPLKQQARGGKHKTPPYPQAEVGGDLRVAHRTQASGGLERFRQTSKFCILPSGIHRILKLSLIHI